MRTLVILVGLAAAVPAGAQQQIAANTGRVYELHEVEVLPRPQNAAEFTAALSHGYPAQLRQAGVGGTVQVAFVVGADGQPTEVRVVSTPDSSFVAPTVQAVSLLRFSPAQVGGQPVAVRVEQPITWRAEAPSQVAAAETRPLPDSIVIPDSIHIYRVEEADARPVLGRLREFTEVRRRFYPHGLRATGTRATVLARFAVDSRGTPRYVHVAQSSDARFDEATMKAVLRLRFQPAQREGRPVWVWMEVPVEWSDPGPLTAADTAEGYELAEVDELPRPTNARDFSARLARSFPSQLRGPPWEEGQVQVRFRVELDGTTSHVTVVSASHDEFVDPTVVAVQMLRFRPAKVNGRPVRVWVEQPIIWNLRGGGIPSQRIETGRMRRGRLSDIVPSTVPCTWWDGSPCQ